MKTDTLFEAIEVETELYRELAASFEKESGMLPRMSVKEIIGTAAVQEEIIRKIRSNAIKRAETAGFLAVAIGLEDRPATLARLLDRIDGPEKMRLAILKARLEDAASKAKAAKDINVRLIDRMLGQIDKTIYVLGGSSGRQDGYGPGLSGGVSSGLLSSRL